MLPLAVPFPFVYGLRTIAQDHGEHMSSALLNLCNAECRADAMSALSR
jgi:hypothetical protein